MSRKPLFPPVFAPTLSHPLVDDFSLRAARQQARQQPAGVPPTHPIPLRRHPVWSGNNELGNQQPFLPDANNRQIMLKMEEWGPPAFWTVCLGLSFDPNIWSVTPPNLASFDLTAFISFGVGGVVQEVEIDWVNGAAITLPMNAVNVVAQYNPDQQGDPLSPNVSEPPLDLVLRCSVAQGLCSGAMPTRSTKIQVDFGDSGEVTIPPFAKQVYVAVAGTGPGSSFATYGSLGSQIRFMSAPPSVFPTAVLLASYDFPQLVEHISTVDGTVGPPAAIPVPTGARTLVIDNNALNRTFQPQFLIGL